MEKKVYLLVGITAHGKSTLGNCILNCSSDLDKINGPFKTSNLGIPCTTNFTVNSNDNVTVIDSMGFGDINYSLRNRSQELTAEFRNILKSVNNHVNAVLFVVRRGHLSKHVLEFFHLVQDQVFNNKMVNNSVLVLTKCEKDWIQKPEQKKNHELQEALKLCHGRYTEFKLDFEVDGDEEAFVNFKQHQRENAVKNLNAYLQKENFAGVDLSFVNEHHFEVHLQNNVMPKFVDVFEAIMHEVHEKAHSNVRSSLTPISDFYQDYLKQLEQRRQSKSHENDAICNIL
jgi:hypothetical protein